MKLDYLVKWRSYGPEHNTYEPQEHLTNAQESIDDYWAIMESRGVEKPSATVKPRKPKARLTTPRPVAAPDPLYEMEQPPLALTRPTRGTKRGRPVTQPG